MSSDEEGKVQHMSARQAGASAALGAHDVQHPVA